MTLISTILDWLRGRIAAVQLWLWRRQLTGFLKRSSFPVGDVDGDRLPGRNARPDIDRYARNTRRER